MPKIKIVREMALKVKARRRIEANRIVGTLGFREHYSSSPRRHSWNLCGHPVYWWVMKCAIETKYVEKIIVWTEDKEAQEVAKQMSDKFVIFDRTIEECKEPMWKFVDDLKSRKSRVNTQLIWTGRVEEINELLGFEPTLLVYFAANQPLIRGTSVTKIIEKYFEDDIAERVQLAVKNLVPPFFYIQDPNYPEYLISCGFTDGVTRQERPDTYAPFGHDIRPYNAEAFYQIHSMAMRFAYVEIGKDEFADIHNEEDLEWADFQMRKRIENERK